MNPKHILNGPTFAMTKTLVATLCVLLIALVHTSDVRAEGEYWAPLYNKLARFINSHDVYAGHNEAIQGQETQEEANERYVENNGVIPIASTVSQAELNLLRTRLIDLAKTKYAISQGSTQYAIEYETDENNLDAWDNPILKSESIFSKAGLDNDNAFSQIPDDYVDTPIYKNSFTSGPVLWEHFQEIYMVANELQHLPSGTTYGTAVLGLYDGFTSQELRDTAVKIVNAYQAVFGTERNNHSDAGDLIAKIENGDYDDGATITKETINILRDLIEQIASRTYARGQNDDAVDKEINGWMMPDNYIAEWASNIWLDVDGDDQFDDHPAPILWNHTDARHQLLKATTNLPSQDGWSDDDIASSGGGNGGGWNGRFENGDEIIDKHYLELKVFIDRFESDGLFVFKGVPTRALVSSLQFFGVMDWSTPPTGPWVCELPLDYFGSNQDTQVGLVYKDIVIVGFDGPSYSYHRADFIASTGDVEFQNPDNSNPHGGAPLLSTLQAGSTNIGVDSTGQGWGGLVSLSVDHIDLAEDTCPVPVTDPENEGEYIRRYDYEVIPDTNQVMQIISESAKFGYGVYRSQKVGIGAEVTAKPLYGRAPFTSYNYTPGQVGGYQIAEWSALTPDSITTTNFQPNRDNSHQALCLACIGCVTKTCELEVSQGEGEDPIPYVAIDIATSSSTQGPVVSAYIADGAIRIPKTALSLGSPDGGTVQAFSLDTRRVSSSSLTDPNTGTSFSIVNILRPQGRVVSFVIADGQTEGKPAGVDESNRSSYKIQVAGASHDILFGNGSSSAESYTIHRYGATGSLSTVAYGPSIAEGLPTSGSLGNWPSLTWDTPLSAMTSALHDIVVTNEDGRITKVEWNDIDTGDNLIRATASYGAKGRMGEIKKELFIDGQWVEVDKYNFAECENEGDGTKTTKGNKEIRQTFTELAEGTRVKTYRKQGTGPEKVTSVTYKTFPWGREMIASTDYDPDTPAADDNPSTYSFYDDKATDGDNYGQLKETIDEAGAWVRYEYDAQGRTAKSVSQFGNAAPGAADNLSRVVTYSYTPVDPADDGSRAPYTPRTVTTSLLGVEVYRSYTVILANEQRSIAAHAAGAAYDDPNNLVSISTTYNTGDFKQGRSKSSENPDGTMTLYDYVMVGDDLKTITYSGEPNAGKTAIADGVRSESVVDKLGRSISSASFDIATNTKLSETISNQFDKFGRNTRQDYLDGTYTTTNYDCCYPSDSTDRAGNTTFYSYDEHGRVVTTTLNGVTTQNFYDVDGNIVQVEQTGTDGQTSRVTSTSSHNDQGELEWTENALQHRTSYSNTVTAEGYQVTTTTFPNGKTRIETYNKDGSLRSVGGTGAHAMFYEYGVDADGQFSIEYQGADHTATQWVKSYTDFLGRNYKTAYADGAVSERFYNSKGQLFRTVDPDGVTTLFAYNGRGQQIVTAVDMNQNGQIDYNGLDRITRSSASIDQYLGVNVRKTISEVWSQDNVDTPLTVATSYAAVDGTQNWQDSFGVISHSQTTIDRPTKTRTVTSTAPNGSQVVTVTVNGQLQSTTRLDSAAVQISQQTYGYDIYGRQNTVTDARNGTTTTFFTPLDQVDRVTTPDPDGAGPLAAQTTMFNYDNMGRRELVTQPDGTTVNFTYFDTGELKKTWGSRTYPVEYTYEDGRVKTMKTWKDHASDTGAATTTWNYDQQRGFLLEKVYDDGKKTTYTYTDAGRLKTRVWHRGVTTTYGYDNAGSMESVDYSDGTPDIAYTYNRRGQRATATVGGETYTATYSDAGQMESEITTGGDLNGLSITNAYDNFLRRDTNGFTLGSSSLSQSTTFDNASRIATRGTGTHTVTYGYHTNSRLIATKTYNNGSSNTVVTSNSYDFLNRSTTTASVVNSATTHSRLNEYNNANQRTKIHQQDFTYWEYNYDSLGQVTNAVHKKGDGTPMGGQDYAFDFDDIGNRKSTTVNGDQATYASNGIYQYDSRQVVGKFWMHGSASDSAYLSVDGRLASRDGNYFYKNVVVDNSTGPVYKTGNAVGVLAEQGPSGEDIVMSKSKTKYIPKTPENFTYDSDGNMLTDGRWSYTWDGENRLIAMEASPAAVGAGAPHKRLEFAYDYQSRRRTKKVFDWDSNAWQLAGTTKFVYDGWNIIAELDGSNVVIRTYLWGIDLSGSQQGAGGVGGLLAMTDGAGTYYAVSDSNGNVNQLINAVDGLIVADYDYAAFGETDKAVATVNNPFRFSSKYQDSETELYYYGYRFYSADMGRWLNRDPIEENGGLNVYGMVGNDAVSGVDYLGKYLVAFDGTGNNKNRAGNASTNVEKMWNGYVGESKYYIGVGSANLPDIVVGGLTGLGGTSKINQAYKDLVKYIDKVGVAQIEKEGIDVIGFSRGAAQAREFANVLNEKGYKKYGLRGRSTVIKAACKLKIRFLGIFDTVSSHGVPGNETNIGYRLKIPDNVMHVRHATAAHEYRPLFPSTKIHPGKNRVEKSFSGAHADVGGGYKYYTDLSKAPLHWMSQEGISVGAPFSATAPLDTNGPGPEGQYPAHNSSISPIMSLGSEHPVFNWWEPHEGSRHTYLP